MTQISLSMIVYFDDPFWIGILHRLEDNQLQVYKIVFGQEPYDEDILNWINQQYINIEMSPQVATKNQKTIINPKRKQREIKKQMLKQGIGTKAMQALKQQYELSKEMKVSLKHQRTIQEKQLKFDLKQQKKKKKHKGH